MRPQRKLRDLDFQPAEPAEPASVPAGIEASHPLPEAWRIQAATRPEADLSASSGFIGRFQALGILAAGGLGLIGLVGGLYYFAGPVVAGAATVAIALLVAWGNWVIDNTM